MPRVLHILPHVGGGGETVVDRLGELTGFEHERVHLSATRTPLLAGPSIAANLVRLRRRAPRADVVHVVGDVAAMVALPALRHRPLVFGTHGLHLLRRSRGVRRRLVQRRLRRVVAASARTVCTSEAERAELVGVVGAGLRDRLAVVPNGVPVLPPPSSERRDRARDSLGLGAADVVALFMGQLEPRKRALDAVAAAKAAAARGVPFVLLLAGEGPQAREVEAESGGVVRFLGFRRDPERLLAAADLFVMPSEREGQSLAVLEAMGHGLAVVASDGSGNPEAVGEAGLLVPVGDREALAEAFVRLAADPGERARLGTLARERVERRFSVQGFLSSMERVFAEAMAPGRGGAAGRA